VIALLFQPKLSEKEIEDLAAALTEQRNPRSENLEKMSALQLAELFVEEENLWRMRCVEATADLAEAIEMVTESLRNGGRLFYVGAGSSGRIGVLDASEIQPTFDAVARPCAGNNCRRHDCALSQRGRRGR